MIALVSQDSLLFMLVKLQNRLPISLSPAVTRTRASDRVPRPTVFESGSSHDRPSFARCP